MSEANRDTVTVERFIAAPASAIFAILADPAQHRLIDGSGTVRNADAGSQRLTLGATFGMSMKMGIGYRMINTVVEFEEDRLIAWQPRPASKLLALTIGGRIWRYELESRNGGTLVKETWDIRQEKLPFMVRPLAKSTKKGMEATLERIEQTVAK
jgi:uncharacterized protein YndB with AHSA1/START domain